VKRFDFGSRADEASTSALDARLACELVNGFQLVKIWSIISKSLALELTRRRTRVFDTFKLLQHSYDVSLRRRFSAIVVTLALAVGQAGVCVGWMSSPEARMACCSDDGPCLMHKSDSRDESTRVLTQAEADRCCAASEQDDSAPSPAHLGFFAMLGNVVSPIPALLPEPEARAEIWRASVPIPTTPVPRHLLLSVFLV
jgi:hypothetical protein